MKTGKMVKEQIIEMLGYGYYDDVIAERLFTSIKDVGGER